MYSHQELCRESNLSYALLREIMTEEEVQLQNDTVFVNGVPLLDDDNKILLVYSNSAVRKRRNNKKKYTYFNAFSNSRHLDLIIDKMNLFHDEVDCIEVEDLDQSTDWFSVKLKNIDNKVMKEIRVFNTQNFTKEKGIVKLLLKQFNVV
jgi:hypothetical protein